MFFWNKFCGTITFFLIFSIFSYAQNSTEIFSLKDNSFTQTTFRTLKCFEKLISFNNGFTGFQNRLSLKKTDNYLLQKKLTDHFPFNITDASAIPADFSTCRYGFFCRMELKLEKATKVPLRFRLGSLERCNYYEGEQ